MTIPTITALPTAPARTDPATFAARADAWVAALPDFTTQANAMAAAMNASALMLRTQRSVSSNDTLVEADRAQVVNCTAALTLGTTAAATLGNGWWCLVRNTGTGNVTVDPNASETIDGQTSGVIYPGFVMLLLCTGTAFLAVKVSGHRRELLTSGTSWTCPIGIRSVVARVLGGGGGGGIASGGGGSVIGSGGGAGGLAVGRFNATPGTAYTCAIGAGGSGRSASSAGAGSAGSSSTFDTGAGVLTGGGGGGGSGTNGDGTAGGTASNGDVNVAGAPGTSNGTRCSVGGSTQFGAGGLANNTTTTAATGYGSGGFGQAGGPAVASEAGRQGCILLEY